jgi:hypothetical protein
MTISRDIYIYNLTVGVCADCQAEGDIAVSLYPVCEPDGSVTVG